LNSIIFQKQRRRQLCRVWQSLLCLMHTPTYSIFLWIGKREKWRKDNWHNRRDGKKNNNLFSFACLHNESIILKYSVYSSTPNYHFLGYYLFLHSQLCMQQFMTLHAHPSTTILEWICLCNGSYNLPIRLFCFHL